MRIEVLSKQLGYDAKNKVIELAKEFDFVRVYDVYKIFPGLAEATYDEDPDPRSIGWRSTDLRTNTVRVRSTASGQRWWLYFPKPDLPISSLTIDKETAARMTIKPTEFEKPMSDKEQIDYLINSMSKLIGGKQKAMVHHKLNKKTIIERPCWFHKWTQNVIIRDDEVIYQDLAICEFPEDGHVERIAWDHIRFVEEWE